MGLSNREFVGRALDVMAEGLEPVIRATLEQVAPGVEWPRILEHKDDLQHRESKQLKATDPQVQLRVLTERLGGLGYPFDLSPEGRAYASEMRQVRNLWAHNEPFTDDDVQRYLDTSCRLLRALGADTEAEQTLSLLAEVKKRAAQPDSHSGQDTTGSDGTDGEDTPPTVVEDSRATTEPAGAAAPQSLIFDSAPELSYAMAYNGQRIISRLTITNAGPEIRGAVLKLSVSGESGLVTQPSEHYLDIPPNQTVMIAEPEVRADPAVLLQLQDRQPGVIQAGLEVDGQLLAQHAVPIELLAAHHWRHYPGLLTLESLAALVQPNHPAVAALCSEASDLLLATTGSGSLEGYQAGPERTDQIAEALAQALWDREVRYSEPPASWGQRAQRVRNADEVLNGRFGTCLDTVVVLAAAMEFAGLQANLWLVQGHIFLGYWRDQANFKIPAVEDPASLVNAIDLKWIRLIETTLLTDAKHHTMEELHERPYARWLTGDMEEVLGVVDLYAARHSGIRPIPVRFIDGAGTVTVIEYTPPRRETPVVAPAQEQRERRRTQRPEPPTRVTQWKNTLLDLSLRNRLINFTATARFPLAVPDAQVGNFEDMINHGKDIMLAPSDEVSAMQAERGVRFGRDLPQDELADLLISEHAVFADVTRGAYQTRMRNLAYKARTLIEETGANNLYLALGSLVWNLDGRDLRSPLVLVPVRLRPTSKQGPYQISLDDAGTSTPNYCLLEKLRLSLGLEIPGLAEPAEDDAGIDLHKAFEAVRVAVAEKGLPFRVEPTVDLSILQFAKFRLWKDLDERWDELCKNPLVHHLVHSPAESFTDRVQNASAEDLDLLATKVPIPADSSQLQAIAEAVAGKTFVLEGPPGTGKSQTITNLLTRAIAEGKRVLFVAEKRAALDVVQKRLDEVGMGVFSLDLHDKGSKPAAVRRQIRQALDHVTYPDRQGLDAALGELNNARRGLVRYATRLHEENSAELSLYSARTQELTIGGEVSPLPVPDSFVEAVSLPRLQQLRTVLSELPDAAEPADPGEDHPWGFLDRPLSGADAVVVFGAARRLQVALNHLPASEVLLTVLMAARTVEDFEKFAVLLPSRTIDIEVLDEAGTDRWAVATQNLRTHMSAFLAASHPGLDKVVPEVLDLPIADIHAEAVTAAASGFFGRKKRLVAVRERIASHIRPGAEVKPNALPELTGALMAVQGAVRGLASGATSIPGIELPTSWNPFTAEGQEYLGRNVQWLEWASTVIKAPPAHAEEDFVPVMRSFFRAGSPVDQVTVDVVVSLSRAVRDLVSVAGLDEVALANWLGGQQFLTRWEKTGRGRGVEGDESPTLRRWLVFLHALEPLRREGLVHAREELKLGHIEADDAGRAFELGLTEASQRERAAASGLNNFEPRTHERMIGRFTARSSEVRQELTTALPDDVLKARTFNADSSGGRMGLLQRQLNYKTGGLRVRALLETHGDLITRIMPCVLVSPDSVARFFPATAELFDLVVFDEASQIRVADAVGAMGRGRAVVVVGDSKQMPPTSFAETTTDRDEDAELANETVEDEESILSECVLARVPRQWLSWHYRSQDESLIAFSNQQYYDNKLSSFPAPVHGPANAGPEGYGISLVRVDGRFHRSGVGKLLRTNPVEAVAVVDEIKRRFDASPAVAPSIGVVTFNLQQRAYIEALLRDSEDSRIADALEVADGLFVKNLENVQGDERDTILFSTGFSKNDRGYLPLNFGPLNRSGGERRLNVAVTRARRQVVVFSSFDPADLRAEETSSVGVKHLRSYLEIAAHGPSALPFDGRRKPAIDRHREQIAGALREQGFAVTTDVGLSDFKVDISVATAEEPGRPLMAVLLDSPAWAARATVGDRDGLPSDVLSRMLRWPAVERVWLPEWLVDSAAVIERLRAAVVSAQQIIVDGFEVASEDPTNDPAAQGADAQSDVSKQEEHADSMPDVYLSAPDMEQALEQEEDFEPIRAATTDTTAAADTTNASIYRPWSPRVIGGIEVLDTLSSSSRSRALVTAVLTQIIDAEGPIHTVRLAKLACAAFSLNKVNSQRAGAVLRLIDQERYRVDSDAFVWSVGLYSDRWCGYRQNGPEIDRKIEHVSKVEIANAMVAVCRKAHGIELEDLKRRVIRVFGGMRVTAGIGERLDDAVRDAQEVGKLHADGAGFIRASPK
ncbi:hypothetical protein IWX65_001004 [Arthrobacter sp. CAN_A214]|uniref:DUF4011 domain-containing protein n=1 Tax=Arthrobacter sp. CAN_A214 TaxID=2787720 RepID=UPI0018C9DCC0